jgi:hypothetical protein
MRRTAALYSVLLGLSTICVSACGHQAAMPAPPARDIVNPIGSSPTRIEHLVTWEPVGYPNYRAPLGDYSVVAPYLDWGITPQGKAPALLTNQLNTAGIISVYYTNPNRQKTTGPEYTSDESTFAHDCFQNRILITKVPYLFYLMNPASPDLYQLWINEVNNVRNTWGGNPRYIFEDTADHINFVTALPCSFTQSAWDQATNTMDTTFTSATTLPIIYNGGDVHLLNHVVGITPSIAIDPTTAGGLTEACFGNGFQSTRPLQTENIWLTTEEQLTRIQKDNRLSICHANVIAPGAQNISARLYVYASYILTYDRRLSIFSELYTTPSNLSVFPEIYLVPTTLPLGQPVDINQELQSGGTYARKFANCDYFGMPVGPCAFVVNNHDAKTLPFPFPGVYNATLRLSGQGILDGGSATLDGPAPASNVLAKTAVVAIKLTGPPPTPPPH